MRLVLDIELGNEAMQTVDDAAQAIHASFIKYARWIGSGDVELRRGVITDIHDANGNRVGEWRVEEGA
jgi:hypothetical protein